MAATEGAAGIQTAGRFAVELAGERIELLADRAAWWDARETLIITDTHFGKAAAFRAMGVPAPEAMTHADLDRLTALIADTGAKRVLHLGDLFHSRLGTTDTLLGAMREWRAAHPGVAFVLVRGNHDRHAHALPDDLAIAVVDGPWEDGPFVCAHAPDDVPAGAGFALTGHLHPCVVLRQGKHSARHRCFWITDRALHMPAFGAFTGCKAIKPRRGDRVVVTDGSELVRAM